MLNSIYNCCINHKQPECQIYWGIFSQEYKDKILSIEFNSLNPMWKAP